MKKQSKIRKMVLCALCLGVVVSALPFFVTATDVPQEPIKSTTACGQCGSLVIWNEGSISYAEESHEYYVSTDDGYVLNYFCTITTGTFTQECFCPTCNREIAKNIFPVSIEHSGCPLSEQDADTELTPD